ncbi:MAG TPA: phosphoribosyl-AMP cyclohydrolase [Chthoniobacteraceae bacterium]|nr:phosphoribosyl-AMP cyclohydrolase [Chthoniobacteraceae bacterium]
MTNDSNPTSVQLGLRAVSALPKLKLTADGLIPAIVQEAKSGRVLMMAWMNEASLKATLETGLMNYWSRSRQKFWIKGETSGHTQKVIRWSVDCDADTLLFQVEQIGGACHTGYESCFYQQFDPAGNTLPITEEKVFDPEKTYAH